MSSTSSENNIIILYFFLNFRVNNHGVVKTFTVRYKCCYGYKRNTESGGGCEKSGELKSILDTLDDMKTDEFKKMIKTSNLESMFADGNYSVFVPSDYALNEYSDKINEMVRTMNFFLKKQLFKRVIICPICGCFNSINLDIQM